MSEMRRRVGVSLGVWVAVACCWTGLAGVVWADDAEDLYFGANALYNRKYYELAVNEYEGFLKSFPEHAKAGKARMGLGLSYYAMGNYAKALPSLEQTVAKDPEAGSGQIRLLLGQTLLQLKTPQKAVAHFQALAQNTAAAPALRADAYAGWGEAQYLQKAWPEVIKISDALWALDPTGARALRARFQGAAARHHLKEFKASGEVLGPLVDQIKTPTLKHQALFLLAECERETGNVDAAEKHYLLASQDAEGAFRDQALFRLGFVQFTRSEFKEAQATFKAFVDDYAKHALSPQAHIYMGRCLLEQKSSEAAEKVLRSALTAAPGSSDAALWLARVYSRSGRFAEAAKVLSTVSAAPNAPREILFDLANAQMASAQHLAAAATFRKVYALGADWSQAPDALRLEGVCLHRAQKYAESLAVCARFLKTHSASPNAADIEFLLGENQFLTGANAESLSSLSTFLSKHAAHESRNAAALRIVQILYGQKKWADALKQAEALADTASGDAFFAQLDFIRGDCLYNMKAWDKAATHFDAFVKTRAQASNADTALAKAALARLQLGDDEEAVANFEGLIATYPKSSHVALALVELGRLSYEAKKYDTARTYLDRAVALNNGGSDNVRAIYYQGWVALSQNRDLDAETRFAAVVKSGEAAELGADAVLQLGLLHVKRAAYDSAIAHLGKFLKNYPAHVKQPFARFYMGVALARSDKHKEALPHFQAIANANPASELADRALYEWAWCAKGLNDSAASIAQYKALLAKYPKSPLSMRAAFELSEIESDSGDLKPAIERLEKLLKRVEDADLRAQILYRLGWCQVSGDEGGQKGVKLLEQLIEDYPASALVGLAHYHAGQATLKDREYTRSKGHFEKAVAFTPPLSAEFAEMALLRLGEVQGLTSGWAESTATFDRFFESYPKSLWLRRAQLGKAWALENQKAYAPALAAYALVLQSATVDETAARAQFQIGECYFALKDYDRALKELLKVEVKYTYPEWVSKSMLEMGRTLEQKGDKVLAVEQYELLLQKYPDSDVAQLAKKRITELSR